MPFTLRQHTQRPLPQAREILPREARQAPSTSCPFEQGRADGAPKGTGGTSAGGPGGQGGGGAGGGSESGGGAGTSPGESGEGSVYRSENNFGSSSHVPGAAAGGKAAPRPAAPAAALAPAAAPAPVVVQAEETVTAEGAGAVTAVRGWAWQSGQLTDSGNTSSSANIGLLVLIVLVAGGVGVFSARAVRLKTQR